MERAINEFIATLGAQRNASANTICAYGTDLRQLLDFLTQRGMTDWRMGYGRDARHWLVLAQAEEARVPGSLPAGWKPRLEEALTAMNETVFAGGMEGLTNTPAGSSNPR